MSNINYNTVARHFVNRLKQVLFIDESLIRLSFEKTDNFNFIFSLFKVNIRHRSLIKNLS